MENKFFWLGVLILFFGSTKVVTSQSNELKQGFKTPPAEYSLLPFWSWNGTLTPDKLTRQIDQMLDKGIYGAFLHARAGLDNTAIYSFFRHYSPLCFFIEWN